MRTEIKCPICGNLAKKYIPCDKEWQSFFDCPHCGNYMCVHDLNDLNNFDDEYVIERYNKEKLYNYLSDNKTYNKTFFLGNKKEYDFYRSKYPHGNVVLLTVDMVDPQDGYMKLN